MFFNFPVSHHKPVKRLHWGNRVLPTVGVPKIHSTGLFPVRCKQKAPRWNGLFLLLLWISSHWFCKQAPPVASGERWLLPYISVSEDRAWDIPVDFCFFSEGVKRRHSQQRWWLGIYLALHSCCLSWEVAWSYLCSLALCCPSHLILCCSFHICLWKLWQYILFIHYVKNRPRVPWS